MSTMKLDDYIARISYDEDREVFHGRIINIRMSSEEHRLTAHAAEHHGESLNAWARKTLDDAARRELDPAG